jgi:hypothetical protein
MGALSASSRAARANARGYLPEDLLARWYREVFCARFVGTKPRQRSVGDGAIASLRSDGSTSPSAGALQSKGAMGALESVCQ